MKEHRDRDRWRGGGSTRIETLTDAVFGFSVTLLVVSLEVPDTFDDLLVTLRGFLAFAASFALLILVWWYHYRLFDRFHLEDGFTVFLGLLSARPPGRAPAIRVVERRPRPDEPVLPSRSGP